MKQRILSGWTFQRIIFLVMGVMILIQSVMERQWIGVAFGAYFASMGLFSFGCASGACYTPNYYSEKKDITNHETKQVIVEEIKQK